MTNFQESCGIAMPPEMPQQLPALIGLLIRKDFDNALMGQERVGGDGESTLRSWMHRNYVFFDDVNGSFCKTDEYLQKFKLAS